MSTQSIVVGSGVALVIVVGAWFVLSGKNSDVMKNDSMMNTEDAMMMEGDAVDAGMMKDGEAMMDESSMETKGDAMMQEGEGAMMRKGSYETYESSKLSYAEQGDVVLFFRATWCPTCKALDASIRSGASSIPAGLTILDVDYDNSATLKKQYGVTYQHTLVQVDSKGNLIKKWSGSPTLAALVAEVQ